MGKRYKVLDGALDYLKYGDTASDVTLPANTPLRKFQEWRNKERKIEYERDNDSLPKSLLDVAIHPFFEAFDTTNYIVVPLSQRTKEAQITTPLLAKANHADSIDDAGEKPKGYKPATCTVSVPNASKNDPNAQSSLTGIKYNKRGTSSYTFPYGITTAKNRESEVRAEIRAAAPDGNNYVFGFTSEVY